MQQSCPACGVAGEWRSHGQDPACYEKYLELVALGLGLRDPDFLHQEVVDAYTAQHPETQANAMSLWFALIGLYLYFERGWSGREIQKAHNRLANGTSDPRAWRALEVPEQLAGMDVDDVLSGPAAELEARVKLWAEHVWLCWSHAHQAIRKKWEEVGWPGAAL